MTRYAIGAALLAVMAAVGFHAFLLIALTVLLAAITVLAALIASAAVNTGVGVLPVRYRIVRYP